jgi:hypothetical protein
MKRGWFFLALLFAVFALTGCGEGTRRTFSEYSYVRWLIPIPVRKAITCEYVKTSGHWVRDGGCTHWDSEGLVRITEHYQHGLHDGEEIDYFHNGWIYSKKYWRNGIQIGESAYSGGQYLGDHWIVFDEIRPIGQKLSSGGRWWTQYLCGVSTDVVVDERTCKERHSGNPVVHGDKCINQLLFPVPGQR